MACLPIILDIFSHLLVKPASNHFYPCFPKKVVLSHSLRDDLLIRRRAYLTWGIFHALIFGKVLVSAVVLVICFSQNIGALSFSILFVRGISRKWYACAVCFGFAKES